MTKRIQIGGSDFGALIHKDLLFVDKTLFIKEILNDQSTVTIITRPRRWGKTLNMSMLHYFLSAEVYGQKTAGLFDQLLIAKEPGNYIAEHQGKYPVIFISLKDVKYKTFSAATASISLLIQDIYSQHSYLLNQKTLAPHEEDFFQRTLYAKLSSEELIVSLHKLSEWLVRHHKRETYILIDEYDTSLNFARAQEYFDDMLLFMKNFLSKTLKDNVYLRKGVMTGILRISKDSMLSGLNNPQIYTVLKDDRYAPYFGFTDGELDLLFANQNLAKNEAEVKAWYNGYCINGLTLYNPWSIMCCLDHKADLIPYWLNTGDDSLLKELIQQTDQETKTQFQSLVLGIPARVWVNPTMRFDQVRTDKTMLWNLLVSAGYLKVLSSKLLAQGFYDCELAIPNHEVMGLYQTIFLEWIARTDKTSEVITSLLLVAEGRTKEFEKSIEHFLKMAASVHDYANQPEAFYQGFMLALSVSLIDSYYIFSNRESGKGRPDLVIIPKDTAQSQAVILEFKTVTGTQTLQARAEEALSQIKEREYVSIIHQHTHIKTALLVGMAFDGKAVCCLQAISSLIVL